MDLVFELIGYIGLASVVLCWVPQTLATVRSGRCDIRLSFVVLSVLGAACLTVYFMSKGDTLGALLNGIVTVGGAINLFYCLFPRRLPTLSHAATRDLVPAGGDDFDLIRPGADRLN